MSNKIEIFGDRENNLKNIDLEFKKNNLVVITGVSGSGKSSLAFNTIYSEGQRRYMESFSAYARSFIGNIERPDVDKINGLSPVCTIDNNLAFVLGSGWRAACGSLGPAIGRPGSKNILPFVANAPSAMACKCD